MLKRKKYIVENEIYKIKNPTKLEEKTIHQEIVNITNKSGKDNIDYDSLELNKYLFEELVESENEDYQFIKYSDDDFLEVMANPPQEFEEIAYHIGTILSDIIMNHLRANLLQIKSSQIGLLQAEAITTLDSFNAEIKELEKTKKKTKKKLQGKK